MWCLMSGGPSYCSLSCSGLHLLYEGGKENERAGKIGTGGSCHLTCECLGQPGVFIEHFFSPFFLHKQHGVWEAKETLGEGLTNGGKEGATEMRVLRCPTV